MPKKALIIGYKGQDGSLLTDLLVGKGYAVIGVDAGDSWSSLNEVLEKVDIFNAAQVDALLASALPDEVYYLAAYHHSSQDKEVGPRDLLDKSYAVNVQGLANVLEAIRLRSPKTRLFYASSSLIFGTPLENPQTETTPLAPECIYGISKVAGMHLCRFYAQKYGVFASIGILYNHESHLRTENFLSKKIVTAAKKIKAGQQQELVVGDLGAQADWGYAPDYVEAMWRILQLEAGDTFIVATGMLHGVADWIRVAFNALGLDQGTHVREDKTLITRKKAPLAGNSAKLLKCAHWRPKTSFEQMVLLMLRDQ